ncbi:MAG: hypothetical protein R3C55_15930 [Parvularculaceae bacterium]
MKKFGIQSVRPIVARGVLIDMVALKGASLAGSANLRQRNQKGFETPEGRPQIWRCCPDPYGLGGRRERIAPRQFMQTEPGLTHRCCRISGRRGRHVAIGADNWGLEVVPAENPENVFPVHQYLLAEKGVYVLENIQTVELASDNAYEFLFILAPPRLEGAVQGIVHSSRHQVRQLKDIRSRYAAEKRRMAKPAFLPTCASASDSLRRKRFCGCAEIIRRAGLFQDDDAGDCR